MNTNIVVLAGRLTRNPEQRFTPNGKSVTTFAIAVNSNSNGKEYVDYFDIEAWNGRGDAVMKHQRKGNRVIVEGQLRQKRWTDQQSGNKRNKVIVRATGVRFIDWGDQDNPQPVPDETDIADDEPVNEPEDTDTPATADDSGDAGDSGDAETAKSSTKRRSSRRRAA